MVLTSYECKRDFKRRGQAPPTYSILLLQEQYHALTGDKLIYREQWSILQSDRRRGCYLQELDLVEPR